MMRYVSVAVFLLLLTSSHAPFAQEAVPRPNAVIPADAMIFLLDDEGKEHRRKFLRLDGRDLIMVIEARWEGDAGTSDKPPPN